MPTCVSAKIDLQIPYRKRVWFNALRTSFYSIVRSIFVVKQAENNVRNPLEAIVLPFCMVSKV